MSDINPYASSVASPPIAPTNPEKVREFSLRKSLFIWTLVCLVSAAPSFSIAITVVPQYSIGAIVLGIAIFILGYVYADFRTFNWDLRQRPAMRWSIYITYWMRAIISIIFPVGIFLDMFCGVVSSGVLSLFTYSPVMGALPIAMVFLWTISHAIVLHVVLFLFWAITYAVCSQTVRDTQIAREGDVDLPS